jgi:hypothetical protein
MLEKMADPFENAEGLDLDEVVSLREELDDLNEKIKSAEEKKHTVKPKIFKKVKADYEEKARQVLEKLSEKAAPLKEEYEHVKANEDTLREKRTAVEEELEEVKFRFSLGEYSKEEHDELAGEKASILEKLEKDIAEIEKSSSLLLDILKRIRDALEHKEEPERASEPAPVEEPVPEPSAPAEPSQAPVETEEAFETVEKPLPHPAHIDEERHGVHIMGEVAAVEPVEQEVEAPPENVHTRSPLDDIVRELEQEMSVPEEPREAAEAREAAVAVGEEAPSGSAEESEEEKELKCPKCGFVNMADSWYCEKCGAELLGESESGGG